MLIVVGNVRQRSFNFTCLGGKVAEVDAVALLARSVADAALQVTVCAMPRPVRISQALASLAFNLTWMRDDHHVFRRVVREHAQVLLAAN